MNPTTTQMDEELLAIDAVTDAGWTDAEDGSIFVDFSPAATYNDLVALHEVAKTWGYTVELDHRQPAADCFVLGVEVSR